MHTIGGYGILKKKEGYKMASEFDKDMPTEIHHCFIQEDRKSHHSDKVKRNLESRLNRIEGQIRGIKGLIEKDTYCDDVITQISATQAALNSVAKILLEGHMKNCLVERIQEGDLEVLDEVLVTIQKLIKK